MEFKKNIVYFYTVKTQLHKPINRFMYNLRSKAIDFFETKKQEVKNANDFNYTLFTSSVKKRRKLHFLLEYFDSFRFVFIDGIYYYNRSLKKIDVSYDRFFSKEVTFLYFTEGLFVEKPIEIVHISTGTCPKSFLFKTRNFIFLGKGSCVKIIESHKNLSLVDIVDKANRIFNSETEVYMHAYSYLEYITLKNDRPLTYSLDHTYFLQEDRSYSNINTFSFCGVSIMNFLSIYQLGKEIHSYINGLSILQEHIIHNTLITHFYTNGKSRDVYKGLFDKRAKTNFNGKIIVLKSAKKTNAIQKSTNILLSNESKVKANPQLEIFAEDVKCSHGCIVGKLNEKEIFYFRSRGISRSDAITKLLFAFSMQILESLSLKRLKNLIKKEINKNVRQSRNS